MKTAKRILSWLLLVCMLLPLASCKKDEGKAPEKKSAAKTVQSRLFAGEKNFENGNKTKVWGLVTGDCYELEAVALLQDDEPHSYTRNEDGFYVLEGFWQNKLVMVEQYDPITDTTSWVEPEAVSITVKLEKNYTGYYVITEGATLDDFGKGMQYAIELRDDGTYVAHLRASISVSYSRGNSREVLSVGANGIEALEVWREGHILTAYAKAEGTYSAKDRGEIRKMALAFPEFNVLEGMRGFSSDEPLEVIQQGDRLTLTLDGEKLTMKRMDDTFFFCQAKEGEILLSLRADGTCVLMFETEEIGTANLDFECVPGRSLQINPENTSIGFVVEGNTLKITGIAGSGDETLILTEVK